MIFKTELEKDRTLFKTNFQTNIIAGNDGKSAYEIWLEQGNEGTEQDFLDSLKGKDGSSTDVTPLTQKIDQNTADIAEINTKIDIEGKLPYTNIASATTAIYQNIGAMNGRIIDLENASSNGGGSSGLGNVIEYASYMDYWYIVYDNGFIAQGGSIDYSNGYGNAYISLMKEYDSGTNSGYDFSHSYYANAVYVGSDDSNQYHCNAIGSKDEMGFTVNLTGYNDDGNGKINWVAIGFSDKIRYEKA